MTHLATCSFADFRPEMGRPIRISLARPKYRTSIESDDRLSDLTPHPSYFRAPAEEFDRRYLAQLDRVGVERLRQRFQALDDGRPLILLCFERHPGQARTATAAGSLSTGSCIPARSSPRSAGAAWNRRSDRWRTSRRRVGGGKHGIGRRTARRRP